MANISHFTQTVNGVSTTYDIHDANAIPRSGGAVVAPNTLIGCTNSTGYLRICGSVNNNTGASIQLNGKDTGNNKGFAFITANDGTQSNGFQIRPNGDTLLTDCSVLYSNKDNNTDIGAPAYRYKVIYATTGTINTSDARFKNNIKDIDNKLLDAWENVEPKQYKFNDATEKKGEKARYHTGYIAQNIQQACEENGVNPNDYGLFCFDEWEAQEERKDENGQVIEPYRPKGDAYSLRYEEALIVECAFLRKKNKELQEQLDKLASRLDKLESVSSK